MPVKTLYQRAVEEGLEMDNHESDLYLRWTREARDLVTSEFPLVRFKVFRDPEGNTWADIPFMFDPFWSR